MHGSPRIPPLRGRDARFPGRTPRFLDSGRRHPNPGVDGSARLTRLRCRLVDGSRRLVDGWRRFVHCPYPGGNRACREGNRARLGGNRPYRGSNRAHPGQNLPRAGGNRADRGSNLPSTGSNRAYRGANRA